MIVKIQKWENFATNKIKLNWNDNLKFQQILLINPIWLQANESQHNITPCSHQPKCSHEIFFWVIWGKTKVRSTVEILSKKTFPLLMNIINIFCFNTYILIIWWKISERTIFETRGNLNIQWEKTFSGKVVAGLKFQNFDGDWFECELHIVKAQFWRFLRKHLIKPRIHANNWTRGSKSRFSQTSLKNLTKI